MYPLLFYGFVFGKSKQSSFSISDIVIAKKKLENEMMKWYATKIQNQRHVVHCQKGDSLKL